MVEQRRLPVAQPLRHQLVLVADVALEVETAVRLGRRVRVEEGDELGAERLVLRPPSELHHCLPALCEQ